MIKLEIFNVRRNGDAYTITFNI